MYCNIPVNCSRCGHSMVVEEWFEEKEYNSKGFPTGRTRTAASNLICPICFHKEIIDDSFDGPWH